MNCPSCGTECPPDFAFCPRCGAALQRACAGCGAECAPDFAFCPRCGHALQASPKADEVPSPAQKDMAVGASVPAAIQRLVPKEYAERLLEAGGHMAGERRLVTILFSDVKGSTTMAERLDPEEVMEIMDGAFDVLIEPIMRYEGTLARLMGDAILAFFGAPIAHEDDPERACRAALEIVEGAKAYASRLDAERGIGGFNVRVGIHTGLVVVGEVGSDLRVEYTAMGDAINVAARMESGAEPGMVLITGATRRLVGRLFETEAIGPIRVKGRAEPVSAYLLVAPTAETTKPRGVAGLKSSIIGRETEIAALRDALRNLEAGVGGIVTIVGEAGIGKSRLVAELRSEAAEHDAPPQWVEGRCLSYGTSIAYLLWLDVLHSVLGLSAEGPPAEAAQALQRLVRSVCPDGYDSVYPYLARIMSLPVDEEADGRLRELAGEQLRANTFGALQELTTCAANQRPLVLVCEDLHWADATSLDLLLQLFSLTDSCALLLICVFRPRRECGCWSLRETAARDYPHRHTDLSLRPLSSTDSEVLISNLLRSQHMPTALRTKVLETAEGNPFFVEEILRSLIDHGVVVADDQSGGWRVTEAAAEVRLPETLQGVLIARIDRLQEDTRRVLQLAAVIGRIFLYRVLAAIAAEERALDAHLLTLQREEMIRERARLPELEYIFKNELTREAAYNGLLKKQRRAFHRQVAEALERLQPDRVHELVGLLAHHWDRAGVRDRAVTCLIEAGDQARDNFGCTEAINHYSRALALARSAALGEEVVAGIQERRGQTYSSIDNMGAAREDLYSVLAWARQTGDRVKQAETLLDLIHPLVIAHDLGRAFDCAQEAHAIGESLGNLRLIARSTGALGGVLCARGELDKAHDLLEKGLESLRSHGISGQPMEVVHYYMMERYWRGDCSEILVKMDEFLAMAEEARSPVLTYATLWTVAMAWGSLGQYEKALEILAQAEDQSKEAGITTAPAELLNTKGWIYQEIYNLQESLQLNEQCCRVAHDWGETESEANALVNLGVDHLWLDHLDQAEHCFVQAWDLLEKQFGGFRWRWKTRLLAAWGHLRLAQGRAQEALDYAEQCLELAQDTSARKNIIKGLTLRGQALVALGQLDEAIAPLSRAVDMAVELANPPLLWKSRNALGEALRQQGCLSRAQQEFGEATAAIRRMAESLSDPQLRQTFLEAEPVCAALRNATG